MAPTTAGKEETVPVRKLPTADPMHVFVGNLVTLKDPEKPDNYLVRRFTAIEGYEIVSTDERDEPFVIEKDQCWVVADNENLKAKEANDSRSFGPVNMTDDTHCRQSHILLAKYRRRWPCTEQSFQHAKGFVGVGCGTRY